MFSWFNQLQTYYVCVVLFFQPLLFNVYQKRNIWRIILKSVMKHRRHTHENLLLYILIWFYRERQNRHLKTQLSKFKHCSRLRQGLSPTIGNAAQEASLEPMRSEKLYIKYQFRDKIFTYGSNHSIVTGVKFFIFFYWFPPQWS